MAEETKNPESGEEKKKERFQRHSAVTVRLQRSRSLTSLMILSE